MPLTTFLNICRSLIDPHISRCLGPSSTKSLLCKSVLYVFFGHNCKSHIVPLSVTSRILPMKMLNLKSVASLLHDIGNHFAPPNIFNPNPNLFTRSEHIHSAYLTRSSAAGNFYIKKSRINKQLLPLSRIGVKI